MKYYFVAFVLTLMSLAFLAVSCTVVNAQPLFSNYYEEGTRTPGYDYYITPASRDLTTGSLQGFYHIIGQDRPQVDLPYVDLQYHPQIDRVTIHLIQRTEDPYYEVWHPKTHQTTHKIYAPGKYRPHLDGHDLQFSPDGTRVMLMIKGQTDLVINEQSVVDVVLIEMNYPDMDTITFEWHGLDYYEEPTGEDQCIRGADITVCDYAQGNSIHYDEDGTGILLSNRALNEITYIRLKDEEIIWRLGGNHSDFQFINDNGFSIQHDAKFTKAGTVTLLDNGQGAIQKTRFVEYELDMVNMTATPISQFSYDFFSLFHGSAQRIEENGHTIIGWGSCRYSTDDCPMFTEIDGNGNVVYEVFHVQGLTNWSNYRAYAFPHISALYPINYWGYYPIYTGSQ